MPHPEPIHYRTAADEPAVAPEPREPLGRVSVPVLGDVDATLVLGRPLHLRLDRQALDLRVGTGLELRAPDLPHVTYRGVHVDLVDGLVESDADAIGPAFDKLLTVALCSGLRHTIGWTPGSASLLDRGAARLPALGKAGARQIWARRGLKAALDPDAALELDLGGDAISLAVTRPMLLRILGLSFAVLSIRYVFGEQRLEVRPGTLGPIRQVLLRLFAWFGTRWLRARLPVEMARPGYDLFADPDRRAHLEQWLRTLGALRDRSDRAGPEEHTNPDIQPTDPHPLAREPEGGAARLFSTTKAALAAGLATLRVSADDMPALTRALVRVPLGPFSSLALCTDRGDEVVVVKRAGGLRLESSRGLYLYADQFPELAELRIKRIHVELADAVALDVQTEPTLGPLLRAALQRAVQQHLLPRVPTDRLRRGGLIPPEGRQDRHVLWRLELGKGRRIVLDTDDGAEVELRHREDALVLSAPHVLQVRFEGLPYLPTAKLRRVAYRWDSGALEVDGDPALGPFGQEVLAALTRVHAVPLAPRGLGLPTAAPTPIDAQELARFSARLVDVRLPVVGRLQLRMDPADTLAASLAPASLSVHSERALRLVAPDLDLQLELKAARYAMPSKLLEVDATAPPGDFLRALSALAVETFLMPLLRAALPLWPDARPDETWRIAQVPAGRFGAALGFSADLSLPPGAALTLRRVPEALIAAATAPLRASPRDEDGLLAEFAVERLRWEPEGGRLALTTSPPAGPLLHELARRLHHHLVPQALLRTLAERLALPAPTPPPRAPDAPTAPPLLGLDVPLLGPLAVHVDPQRPLHLDLRREGLCLGFAAGLVVRLPDLGVHVVVRGAALTFLPFTLDLTTDPPAGELERWLSGHVLRGLFARSMQWFWPTDRSPRADHDTLLSFGAGQPWGPLDVCVDKGGELELLVEREGATIHSSAGLSLAGETAERWLPAFVVHELALRFTDGTVRARVGGIAEHHYRELETVGASTLALLGHLVRLFVMPRAPAWTQRLGLRVLPPPPPPPPDPTRVVVLQAQLPGGYARVSLAMDPHDVLAMRADRREIVLESARHLHLDIPGLHLRLELRGARYHLQSGEVQVASFGQLENAVAETVLRRVFTTYEPDAAAAPDMSALAAVLSRFPVDDQGRRVLYDSKMARVLLRRSTALVVRLGERGLVVTADPPIEIDGLSVLDYRFGGLRYSFDDASFHLDIDRDGVLAGMFRNLLVGEGENQLNSALRPLLPAAMRTPGYRLAADPDPRATITALVRSTVGGAFLLTP